MQKTHSILLAIIVGIVVGGFFTSFYTTEHRRIADYYAAEVSVNVSPHELEKILKEDNAKLIIVDLRDAYSYQSSHVAGAINISGEADDVVAEFKKLPKDAQIITYCYDEFCMLSRRVGDLLAQNGIYAQHLNSGFAPLLDGHLSEEFIEYGEGTPGVCTTEGELGC